MEVLRNSILYVTHVFSAFNPLAAVATSGRVDRMFQVLPDQEDNIRMEDMLSDGLLVVELGSSPTGTPQPKTGSLLSPSEDTV